MAYKVINGKLVKTTRAVKIYGYRTTIPVETPVKKEKFPEDKGQYLGSCNRSACLAPGANWYNRVMYAYYCKSCAKAIDGYRIEGEEPLLHLVKETDDHSKLYVKPSA